jgi:hypothetical protein
MGSLANTRSTKAVHALFTSKEKSIRYLMAMEDSPRTRAACVQLLQDWVFDFWGHHDVVAKARTLAADLGGTLERPALKWKYTPVTWVFGYDAALKTRRILPAVRARMVSRVDQLLYKISKSRLDKPRSRGPFTRRAASARTAS